MKKSFTLAIFLFVVITKIVSGYDNLIIHPKFARKAAELFNSQGRQLLTNEQIDWIVAGAIKEDADPRYLNHFYDYRTGLGLLPGLPATLWSQNQELLGDFSETAILSAYRSGNEQLAYNGVGHQLHLVEDMAVPAHVRNDPHNPDPYEEWCQKNNPELPEAKELYNIVDIQSAIRSLASYTGNNFYSKDDINGSIAIDKIETINGANYAIKNDHLLGSIKKGISKNKIELNDNVYQDNFNQLAPKAIGYSAGVVEYFQKKFSEIDSKKPKENKILSFIDTVLKSISRPYDDLSIVFNDVVTDININVQLKTNDAVKQQMAKDPSIGQNLSESLKPTLNGGITQATIEKTSEIIQSGFKKTKVLGEKIASSKPKIQNSSTDQVVNKLKPIVKSPKIKEANEPIKIFTINPAKADTFINPDLLPAIKTSLPPIYTANHEPANDKTIVLPKPIVYPKTFLINKPAKRSSSSVAEFFFESDQASSSFEYMLDAVASSSDWISASSSLFLKNLSDGIHSVKVRAVNNGFTNPNPVIYTWTIDTTAPATKISADLIDNGSVDISWSLLNHEDGVLYSLDYRFNGGDWSNLLTATDTASFNLIKPFENGDVGEFRVTACDTIGNCESSNENNIAKIQRIPDHLLISALQVSGTTAKDEWVELYNPTASDISLGNYKLKRKSSLGEIYNLVPDFGGAVIKSHGYYLIAHPDYDGREPADHLYAVSNTIADDNSVVLLNGSTTVDKVSYGMAKDSEGAATYNPQAEEILVRKSDYSGYSEWRGNARDTDNNLNDFIITADYRIHSSDSAIEPTSPLTISGPAFLEPLEIGKYDATLKWQIPQNAKVNETAKYEFKYATSSSCQMNNTWRNLSATDIPVTDNMTDTLTISGLKSGGTGYCASLRVFNGSTWSTLSNDLYFQTKCEDFLHLLNNYSFHLSEASVATSPSTTPEKILVVDFVDDRYAVYDIYGAKSCNILVPNAANPADVSVSLSRLEMVYDPDTLEFTGQFRYCSNTRYYAEPLAGDHCYDRKVSRGARWTYYPALKGETSISLRHNIYSSTLVNYATEWISLK